MQGEQGQDSEAAQAGGSEEASCSQPAKRKKRNPRPSPPAGARRSSRVRVPPLRHWKNERVVYGRSMTTDGKQRVLGMVDVVRFPKEEVQPLAMRQHGRKASARLKSESVKPTAVPARHARRASAKTNSEHEQPSEELWDLETQPKGIVYSFTKRKDCERTIVHTKHMTTINIEGNAGDGFQYQRVCKDADYVSAGLLFISVGGGKPLKPTKDNFYVFTVLEGAVSVRVHQTTFVVGPMGMFWVPRGNGYLIKNISHQTAKLTFTQARRTRGEEPVPESNEDEERSRESTPTPTFNKRRNKGKRKAT